MRLCADHTAPSPGEKKTENKTAAAILGPPAAWQQVSLHVARWGASSNPGPQHPTVQGSGQPAPSADGRLRRQQPRAAMQKLQLGRHWVYSTGDRPDLGRPHKPAFLDGSEMRCGPSACPTLQPTNRPLTGVRPAASRRPRPSRARRRSACSTADGRLAAARPARLSPRPAGGGARCRCRGARRRPAPRARRGRLEEAGMEEAAGIQSRRSCTPPGRNSRSCRSSRAAPRSSLPAAIRCSAAPLVSIRALHRRSPPAPAARGWLEQRYLPRCHGSILEHSATGGPHVVGGGRAHGGGGVHRSWRRPGRPSRHFRPGSHSPR